MIGLFIQYMMMKCVIILFSAILLAVVFNINGSILLISLFALSHPFFKKLLFYAD